MLTLEKTQTIDDFKKIEEGKYCQLINGEIIMSPSPSTKHQRISKRIFKKIDAYVEENYLGETFYAPIDVYFDEENAFEPDILFVSKERLDIIKEDGIYGAPDLVIEILSLSNSYHDTKTKKKIYEKYGVKEYWLVDPMDGEAIGFKNENGKFIEFYKGTGEFTIKLLSLKIEFVF
ncbi:MAG: Uma2 family endonuclease [Bacteroidia bacterium]|nr:Uma2 family endonuclease [Bacteroidia bacterium]